MTTQSQSPAVVKSNMFYKRAILWKQVYVPCRLTHPMIMGWSLVNGQAVLLMESILWTGLAALTYYNNTTGRGGLSSMDSAGYFPVY